ncbi:MAG: hypothetical protein HC908_16705 [Calothrix sp. SM1_7_51]|nr:hypothetical protein [Calothrix sp. SM1_7_51]
MARLLHLDASPRSDRSHSGRIIREFVETCQQFHPNDTVTYRDIGHNPIPHVDEPWIAAAFTAPEQRTDEIWSALSISEELSSKINVCEERKFVCQLRYSFQVRILSRYQQQSTLLL